MKNEMGTFEEVGET